MIPVYDPIFSVILFVGLLIYFGLKDIGEKLNEVGKKEMTNEEFIEWLREKRLQRDPENRRYQKWLYNHQN